MSYACLMILAVSHLVVDMYLGFLMPLLPALEVKLGVSFAALAGVVGICAIVVNLIQPLAARFSKLFPMQTLLIIGPAISGTLALIGVVESYEAFLLISVISVIGTGIFHPDGVVAAHVASGEHEHIGVPVFFSGGFFGFSSGAIISSQWFMNYEFDGFWLLALPGVLCTILIVIVRKHILPEDLSESTVIKRDKLEKDSERERFHIFTLVVLAFCLVTPVAVTYTMYSKYLEELHGEFVAIEWSGIVLAVLGLFGAGGSYLWGWLSKNHSRYMISMVTQVLSVIVFLVFLTLDPGFWLLVVTPVLGVLWGSSVFPVIATAAKSARGLNATERAGWVVGGSWGIAGLFQMIFGMATAYDITLATLVKLPVVFIVCGALFSAYLWRKEKTMQRDA